MFWTHMLALRVRNAAGVAYESWRGGSSKNLPLFWLGFELILLTALSFCDFFFFATKVDYRFWLHCRKREFNSMRSGEDIRV